MNESYLVIDGIEIVSKDHLEQVILNLSEESKTALRLIYEEQSKILG